MHTANIANISVLHTRQKGELLDDKEFSCITLTVKHNYISPSSIVGIQLSIRIIGIQPVIIGRVFDVHVAHTSSCCAFISLHKLTLTFQHFHILALRRVMNISYFLCIKFMNSDAPVVCSLACFLMNSTDTYR